MKWKLLILALMLSSQSASVGVQLNDSPKVARSMETRRKSNSVIICKITTSDTSWRLKKSSATVSVEIQYMGSSEISVMPSLELFGLPKKEGLGQIEYWAPFALSTGESTKSQQKLAPTPKAGPLSVHLLPRKLFWASSLSSVWPDRNLVKTVPPGNYSVQVQLELSDGTKVVSNEIPISILK
jgi:hypothetical protein